MKEQQHVLLVSYNAMSKENANGRTLEFLLGAYDKNEIAQLYFSSDAPDFSITDRYYRVDEKNVLKALIKGGNAGAPVRDLKCKNDRVSNRRIKHGTLEYIYKLARKNKRSSWVKFARNLLWKRGEKKWRTSEFEKWVLEFAPDVILTISGKNSCFHDIALNLANKYDLPLITYHCEDYCFKDLHEKPFTYKQYIRGLKKSVDRLMERTSFAIYNSECLRDLYEREYSTPSMVAYMSTDMISRKNEPQNDHVTLSYMGNLGLGRFESLCEIGEVLNEISPDAILNIYSASAPDDFLRRVEDIPNIQYKGFVDYKKCREIMYASDLLIHAEGFNEQTVNELRIAFSTKIADYLASGVPILVYAPRKIALTEYLIESNAACVVAKKDELPEKLKSMIFDNSLITRYVQNALSTAEENHNFGKTVSKIRSEITNAIAAYRGSNEKK